MTYLTDHGEAVELLGVQQREIERLTAEIERLRADHEALFAERERLRTSLLEARPYVPEHHGPVQAKIREAFAPLNQQQRDSK